LVRAVTFVDGEIRWQEHPDPAPGDGELLVAVRAAGLNAADLLQRRGRYPAPPGSPADIPGLELAGEVVAVGRRVERFAVGDRVAALVGGGGQAELAVVDERVALAVPDTVGWVEVGGFPEAFCTAHDALFRQCRLTMGDRVLVTGAAGGVGTAAVQLAAAAGAQVVASCRHPAFHDDLAALGAAEVAEPDEALERGPFDVVVELVGAPSLTGVLPRLATGGRVVVIGVGAGARLEVDLLTLMGHRAQVSGVTLRARSVEEKGAVVAAVGHAVVPLLARGALRVPVAATVPMVEADAAYERFSAGAKLGKVVLVAP
jgi:NADPH:quinone reductase-like Zn-dependent oxidoreductase